MKRERYLEKYIGILEHDLQLERKEVSLLRKDLEFYRGKCERLELVVMMTKGDAGKDYVERTDRMTAPVRRTPIQDVPVGQTKLKFRDIKNKWDSLTEEERDEAFKEQNLIVEPEGRPS
jgi:hypothetical protein